MKQHIVPTSPKSEHHQQRSQKTDSTQTSCHANRSFFVRVCATVILGVSAGVVGALLACQIPPQWPVLGALSLRPFFEMPSNDTVVFSDTDARTSLVQDSPEVIEQSVLLYDRMPSISASEQARLLGTAVVLTSDGWCAVPSTVFASPQKKGTQQTPEAPVVVLHDGSTATIQKMITDDVVGVTFFQLDVTDMSPVVFYDEYDHTIGEGVTVLEQHLGTYQFFERRISGIFFNTPTQSTDTVEKRYTLDTFGKKHLVGAPVYSDDATLIGMIDGQGRMIHASFMAGQLESLLQDDRAVEHIAETITYIPLHTMTKKERDERSLPSNGIFVLDIVSGQAQEIGLKKDDVILSINNTVVNKNTDLSTILNAHAPGTTFLFAILRDGQNMNIDYTTQKYLEEYEIIE